MEEDALKQTVNWNFLHGFNGIDFKRALFPAIARAPICENVAFQKAPIQLATSGAPFERKSCHKSPPIWEQELAAVMGYQSLCLSSPSYGSLEKNYGPFIFCNISR